MKKTKMLQIMLDSFTKPVPYHDDGGIQLSWQLTRLLDDMILEGILPPITNMQTNEIIPKKEIESMLNELDLSSKWEE